MVRAGRQGFTAAAGGVGQVIPVSRFRHQVRWREREQWRQKDGRVSGVQRLDVGASRRLHGLLGQADPGSGGSRVAGRAVP